ncbi:hypothetical protein EXS65_00205 [Candidatus Peribacteria bacterium]|nr:hypothetical protein [Candidatus Peribacteria bacterium]
MKSSVNTVEGHHDELFGDLDHGTEAANVRAKQIHQLVAAGTHTFGQAMNEVAGMDDHVSPSN